MKNLPRAVIILAIVSFFTDLSSEMIYPLLPVFLSSVLGAGALALGLIEGIAESTAALFKVVSGIWTDKVRKRKPFIVAGYGIAGMVRPLIGLATGWPFVLAMRFIDRIGKGLRTSPRDALIADVTDPAQRGLAFGFHRSTDHAGAVLGPLVAAALLGIGSFSLQHVFLLAFIPAVLVVVILVLGIKEVQPSDQAAARPFALKGSWRNLGGKFKVLLLAILVFTLGNSTDAFLILRLSNVGVPAAWIAILWSAHHVVKMVATLFGGRLTDRVGPRFMVISGWLVYAAVYLAFAFVDSPRLLIGIFMAYGIYFGFAEPSERVWVAELVPAHLRGTAFGYFHGVVGLGALPASLIFGALWHTFGAYVAFITGAALAAFASTLLLLIPAGPEPAFYRISRRLPFFQFMVPRAKPLASDVSEEIDK